MNKSQRGIVLIFRYQDPKNYYIVEADSQGDSCTFFRVKKGKRKFIASNGVIITPYIWHELRISVTDDKYTALVDGNLVLGTKDSAFLKPGLVGIATKADSVMAFDDFRIAQ